MIRMLKIIGVLGAVMGAHACAQPAPVSAPAPAAPAPPTQAQAAAHFERWKAALATKDPKIVAGLFRADAILAPTVSNDVRTTPQEVEAYFVDFLKLSPKPTLNERYLDVLDDTIILDAGVWTFVLTRNGNPEFVTARYSFVWEREGEDWKIQLLHSSLMPEPVRGPSAPLPEGFVPPPR